jgi:adenylylsulfate kinase
MNKNIVPHQYGITRHARNRAYGHNSMLLFFTGLSGSGKSTIANALEEKLFENGIKTFVLDGDNIRTGINKNLSFSPEDRQENIRRIGEVAKLFVDAGIVVLAAFVAPYKADRKAVCELLGKDSFIEVFVNTSLEICEARDVKGLYAKARAGEIRDMTGVTSPYEVPENPDIEISSQHSIEESVNQILGYIESKLSINS